MPPDPSPDDVELEARRLAPKAPVSMAAGPQGQPLHPLIVTLPIGAWVISFAFDLAAHTANEELVYARASFWLIGIGIVAGVAAAATGLLDLLAIPRDTPAFRTGIVHLSLSGAALVLFALSFLLRRGDDSLEAAGAAPMALSLVALLLLAVSGWLGVRLAFRYGVRVVDEDLQAEGFVRTGGHPAVADDADPAADDADADAAEAAPQTDEHDDAEVTS